MVWIFIWKGEHSHLTLKIISFWKMQRNTQILQFFFFKMSFDILSVKKKYCKGFSSLSPNSMEHLQLDQSVSTYKLVFIVSNSSIIKTFLKINKRPTWEKRIYIELLLIFRVKQWKPQDLLSRFILLSSYYPFWRHNIIQM